jgi:citrate/tricarballylate utilization protein
MLSTETLAEAERVMIICNACRYCEGHCAVFPAMEIRLAFSAADLNYLANLCHNCGACYYHCQYAPPHEFAVNVPQVFSDLRAQTWREYAWPGFLARAFDRNALAAGLITAASLALVMLLTFALVDPGTLFATHTGEGAFYAVIPHNVMVVSFGAVAVFVVVALIMGLRKFWADIGESLGDFAPRGAFWRAVWDALTLRYLDGGSGDGCTYPSEAPSRSRRWHHHLTFYGFMLCFASTCVATVYHYAFGWKAPYPWASAPVVLGTVGGIGLLIGPAGLLWLRREADPEVADPATAGMGTAFILLLFLTNLTGLLLLVLRATPAMGVLLAIHLGVVLALFVTLPYGKFVHAVYRFAAIVRYRLERTRPPSHALAEE